MHKSGHDMTLSKGKVKDLMKEAAGDRISDDAVLRVIFEQEDDIQEIAQLAQELASHAGRKTIMEEDVRLAYKHFKQ